ncbi:MAG: RNA polymerase sigma factor (sigma-70 family) [Paraglaciecola sp.]
MPDWEIIQRVLKGEKALLGILYDRYSDKVYYKCLSITKNADVSKDLAHDIIIKTFMNLAKFKGTSDFSFWVKSITYNFCMDYLKRKKRLRFGQLDASDYETIAADEIELENKILKEIQLEQLETLFVELKADDKLILLMRYQDKMSVKIIASSLKISESAVKMRLKRSRDRLAELLKSAQDEG